MFKNWNKYSLGKKVKWIGLGALTLIALITFMVSWEDVPPGHQGVVYKPYNGGVDKQKVYNEGTYLLWPWNEMETFDVRQKSNEYTSEIMDKNGTDITVSVAVNYSLTKGQIANIYLDLQNYEDIVNNQSLAAVKNVVGRYNYQQVYSTQREALEKEIEDILRKELAENFMTLHYVRILDVNLPGNISTQITEKETQKERNKTAQLKEKEEEFLANALIEKARGDSALVISAQYKADAIELESAQLKGNSGYTELKKWEKWDGKGSPYGNNNVFGDKSISILKGKGN
ncbi:MAG: HflC/HflK family inner membrane lipoprotein [uncultured marine phage]|uniref:HflC/HflK family inner membrane lipoprotein n=1 Tax=uncultured marine phage TaxID=707152 RepID=A0A8D9CCY7_9VIRU|nr:MAG: HflC/HflK family inner membrane lipoprotein [uncultured marine phage]